MKLASHAMNRLRDLYGNILQSCRQKNLQNFSYLDRLRSECTAPLLEQLEPRVLLSGSPVGGIDPLEDAPGPVGAQPTLVIDDVTMPHNEQSRDITLPETDGDGQVVVYSAQTIQPEDTDFTLKTQLGLTTYLPKYDNYRGAGLKWMRNNVGRYFYMQPDGEVTQYRAGVVGQFSTDFYADPQAGIDAAQQTIPNLDQFISITGNVLTVQPAIDFVGTFSVQATATDNETDPVTDTFSVTINNNSPVWAEQAADQVLSHNDPCVVSISATDPDTDGLSYSFAVNTAGAEAYELKTDLGLATYISRYDNLRGAGHRWFRSDAGLYYYIKSTGEVFQHRGGQVGQVDVSYAVDPQSLIDQPAISAPVATFTYIGGDLTVNAPADFVGTFQVDVIASDGAAPITDTFTVTITNDGPVWENLPTDQTMSHNTDTLVLALSATDADSDAVTYTAVVGTDASDAYTLKTQLSLNTYIPRYNNIRRLGEKWMKSDARLYYYILPNGEVYQNRVGLVGQVAASYYADPQTLIDQVQMATPVVPLTIANGELTIDPAADFLGTFQVDVTANDGTTTISDTFTVSVTNDGPVWENLPTDQTMSHNTDTLVLALSATDADSDSVTYTAVVGTDASEAYTLKTDLGLSTCVPRYNNARRLGEKWMKSDARLYYYILPNGEVYQHRGGLVGQVAASYYANPQTLIDQVQMATPVVPLTIANGELTIDPAADFAGTFQVDVTANDGTTTISDTFTVSVTNDGPATLAILDQTVLYNDLPATIDLGSTTDADNDTVTYSVEVSTFASDAYTLKTDLGLSTCVPRYNNIRRLGEKWMKSNARLYYYILPNGEVYQHRVGLVGQVAASYYADPQTLIDQQAIATPNVTITVDNSVATATCTIEPPADFLGTFQLDVVASDGVSEVSDTFAVTIENAAPVWENLPTDQTMSHNTDTLVLDFSATDADGDTITYTYTAAGTPTVDLTIANGELTIDPPADFVGDIVVAVSASDGLAQIQDTFTVTVENTAPSLLLSDRSVAPGNLPLIVDLGPTVDVDGDTVTYTVETVTPNVTITIDDSGDRTTCTIQPEAQFLGTIPLAVSATDGVANAATTFNMLVEETPSITAVDYWITETSAGVWDVSVSVFGSETAGLSAYSIWVYADPGLVTYTENTLGTVGAGFEPIGFQAGNLISGDVAGNFNAGNFQNVSSALLGIGKIAIDNPGEIPGTTPHVNLGVPALLGTLTTPEGLGVGDFNFDGIGLFNAAGDGYLSSPPTPTLHINPI